MNNEVNPIIRQVVESVASKIYVPPLISKFIKYLRSDKVYKTVTSGDNTEYQMMTDEEVFEKYSNIPKNKIEIIDVPSVIYNSDEKKILYNFSDYWEIKNNKLQIKNGNEVITVDTCRNYPKKIEDGYKLLVFRHKTDDFRFKVLQLI